MTSGQSTRGALRHRTRIEPMKGAWPRVDSFDLPPCPSFHDTRFGPTTVRPRVGAAVIRRGVGNSGATGGAGTGGTSVGGSGGGPVSIDGKIQAYCAKDAQLACATPDCVGALNAGLKETAKKGCATEWETLLDCAVEKPLSCSGASEVQPAPACATLENAHNACLYESRFPPICGPEARGRPTHTPRTL